MKRTQLNLDEKTYYQLVSYARDNKTSLSGAARNLISKQIRKEIPSAKNVFMGLVKLGERLNIKLPKDASINHDYYLYGEGNPKFASHKK